MARIVLATIGSFGDLHPVLALALELRRRGHEPSIATSENYRDKISALGFAFHPLRPDLLAEGEHVIAAIMDGPRGSEFLVRERMFPAVRAMHEDLARAIAGADLLIASELVFAAPILAETRGIRWVSFELAPTSLFALHDPPILPLPNGLHWVQRGGPRVFRLIRGVARLVSQSWWRPIRELRRELGLPPGGHPLFEGKYSPRLNLVLFSPVLQRPQPDWPAATVQTGFLFHDETAAFARLPREVETFLGAGPPPIVFTLGSAAVYIAGSFYTEAVRAAERLGRRALLLVGKNPPPPNLPASIFAWDYLPFAAVFPRAAAIVHQGGVGTTAQALRAGRPMLVVPFAHDQFDNAARVVRLGVARTIARERFSADSAARELHALLANPRIEEIAAHIGTQVRVERGLELASDAIERVLDSR